jgi:hypothetical protein
LATFGMEQNDAALAAGVVYRMETSDEDWRRSHHRAAPRCRDKRQALARAVFNGESLTHLVLLRRVAHDAIFDPACLVAARLIG